jgi:spore germination protein GerM
MAKKAGRNEKILVWSVLVLVSVAFIYGIISVIQDPIQRDLPPEEPVAETQQQEILVYFSQSSGNPVGTGPVTRPMTEELAPVAIDVALKALLAGPNEQESLRGLFSEIPKGTQLLNVSYKPDELRVNLSKQFISGGGVNSMQQRLRELTQTIRAVEKDVPVYIDIEGQELDSLGGEGVIVDEPVNQGKNPIQ